MRTFAKSELIRAMSFVAIPGLIGPMLGPIAGGLIVAYLHWRLIFFVNIPIGLVGLFLVHRHLPDYREAHTDPLDVAGLLLFGSGVALLSYVLEVFGEHTLSAQEILALLVISGLVACGLWLSCIADTTPPLAPRPVSHSHVPRGGERQLRDASRHRWYSLSFSPAVPGGASATHRSSPGCS